MPESKWLQRIESGVAKEESKEIANMDLTDYAALLEETEFK